MVCKPLQAAVAWCIMRELCPTEGETQVSENFAACLFLSHSSVSGHSAKLLTCWMQLKLWNPVLARASFQGYHSQQAGTASLRRMRWPGVWTLTSSTKGPQSRTCYSVAHHYLSSPLKGTECSFLPVTALPLRCADGHGEVMQTFRLSTTTEMCRCLVHDILKIARACKACCKLSIAPSTLCTLLVLINHHLPSMSSDI